MQIVGFNRVRPLHNWIAWISPNQYRSTLADNDTNVIQIQYKHHNESNENWYWHGKVWRRAKIEDDSGFSWQQRAASDETLTMQWERHRRLVRLHFAQPPLTLCNSLPFVSLSLPRTRGGNNEVKMMQINDKTLPRGLTIAAVRAPLPVGPRSIISKDNRTTNRGNCGAVRREDFIKICRNPLKNKDAALKRQKKKKLTTWILWGRRWFPIRWET